MEINSENIKEYTLSIRKVNLYSLIMIIPITAILLIPFILIWNFEIFDIGRKEFMRLFIYVLILGIILHELLHGITWAFFSKKGFKIKEGVVEYRMIGDNLIFDSVYIKGGSATIVGKGEVDIKKRSIKMDLAIQTARKLGKFIGNLPVLGYILMGDDKSMTFGLKITGTLNQPKVKTSAAKDILILPLDLIKRTIESPAHMMKKKEPVPKKETPSQIKKSTPLNKVSP